MMAKPAPSAIPFPNARLLVFAKAPVAGQVKTRMMPYLDPQSCAALQRWLTERTLTTAVSAAMCRVELWCAPHCAHPFFRECESRYGVALCAQWGATLGARMSFALRRALERADFAIIVGCDCPVISPAYLKRACALLVDGAPVVVGPAEDGGYVLIGLSRKTLISARDAATTLFTNITWGTPAVMEQTRARLRGVNWEWHELEPLWDVDRPTDLARLKTQQQEWVRG
ncbi:MAG: TIGR04282 family arsenosugar biosynthesis glycosyltransferase [Pseudomonadota bacterium]|nr:TIGR04282 family arsenosugar biosynthesis glycosyltransferase [Pseudomonadota bacterium]